jgi:histidyl-tRNA synthetase
VLEERREDVHGGIVVRESLVYDQILALMKPLPGFRDLYPADFARRNHLTRLWRAAARKYGFVEFDGPTLEPADLYRRKNNGGEILGQLYEFTDKGERDVSLRPEVTPTLARMIAARHRDFPKPLRWFNVGSCFRYERQQRGRLREFLQFNCDLVGDASPAADAEVIALLIDLLRSFGLGPEDFAVRLSDRSAWHDFLGSRGISGERTGEFLQIVDRIEKLPEEKTVELLAPFGIPLGELKEFIARSEIPSLAPLLADLEARGLRGYVRPDLGVVRGLAYYTGVVFEAFALKAGLRAIAGGGRYDRLLADLSEGAADLPAIGFGVGDAVLLELLDECPAAKAVELAALAADSPVQVYLVLADESRRAEALALAQDLRGDGWRVGYPLGSEKVGKQFGHAETLGASHAVVVGAEWPLLKVKRLADRVEDEVSKEALPAWLARTRKSET